MCVCVYVCVCLSVCVCVCVYQRDGQDIDGGDEEVMHVSIKAFAEVHMHSLVKEYSQDQRKGCDPKSICHLRVRRNDHDLVIRALNTLQHHVLVHVDILRKHIVQGRSSLPREQFRPPGAILQERVVGRQRLKVNRSKLLLPP